MTIQQAIVKAYSQGWRHKAYPKMKPKTIKEDTAKAIWYSQGDGIFIDPLFWQSLGKAMGWCEYSVCRIDGKDKCYDASHRNGYENESIYQWHRFIDHLAENKSAESFFETL